MHAPERVRLDAGFRRHASGGIVCVQADVIHGCSRCTWAGLEVLGVL